MSPDGMGTPGRAGPAARAPASGCPQRPGGQFEAWGQGTGGQPHVPTSTLVGRGHTETPGVRDTPAVWAGLLCSHPPSAQPPLSPAWVARLQQHLGTGSTWPGVGSGCPARVGTLPPSALASRSCASPGSGSGPEQTGELCKQALTGPRCLPSPCAAAGPSHRMGMLRVSPVRHREVPALPTLPGEQSPLRWAQTQRPRLASWAGRGTVSYTL